MEVHLHTACWNDLPILPFFLEHYRPFVDRFFVHDDGSDDGSWEYLEAQPGVEAQRLRRSGADSIVEEGVRFYGSAWKRSRGEADWVLVPDLDEFLHAPSFGGVLARARRRGWTVLGAAGFQMVSPTFPRPGTPLLEQVPNGVPCRSLNKTLAFDPDAVEDIGYAPGRHACSPQGRIRHPPKPPFRLLHYKHLGWEYVQRRHQQLAERLLAGDRARGHGEHYRLGLAALRVQHDTLLDASLDVVRRRLPPAWRARVAGP